MEWDEEASEFGADTVASGGTVPVEPPCLDVRALAG